LIFQFITPLIDGQLFHCYAVHVMQVSSGAILKITVHGCDIPYRYQGVTFDKWAAG